MNIHARVMVVINTDTHGDCEMIISERGRDGTFVVCNEIHGEEAINTYRTLIGAEENI